MQRLSSFDGTKLYIKEESVSQPQGAVIIVHGLGEHLGRYDHLAEELNKAHYHVYRYDQRGHGNSEGVRCHLNRYYELPLDLYEVVKHVRETRGTLPLFILGQSMGGLTALLFAAMYPEEKVSYIISAAPSPMGNVSYLIPNGPDEKYIEETNLEAICSDENVVQQWREDPLTQSAYTLGLFRNLAKGMEYLKKHISNIQAPMLFLHGSCDKIVPPQQAWDNFSHLLSSEKSLRIYERRFHEVFHDVGQEEVIADVLRWIREKSGINGDETKGKE